MNIQSLFDYVKKNVEEVVELLTPSNENIVATNIWKDYEEELSIRRESGDCESFSAKEYVEDKYNSIGWDWVIE